MATTPQNYAPSITLVQNQATATLATWCFRAVNSADSSNATAKTFTMTLSKNGAAFASPNVSTAITEIANGWYKVVHAAGDLDTLGTLSVHLTASGVDIIATEHQVRAFNENTATVNVGAGGIDSTDFTSAALSAVQAGLTTINKTITVTANSGDFPLSMFRATDCTITVSGTFGGGTAQIQTTEDPVAGGSPVWTNNGTVVGGSGSSLTSNGAVLVTGPHNAARVHWTGATSPSISITFTIRKPPGT